MNKRASYYRFFLIILIIVPINKGYIPIVINTWRFTNATEKAWEYLSQGKSSIEALEAGCTVCEIMQCDGTVGYGGSPDENGETTLDALIFDGLTMNMGAVGALRRVKNVISVAKYVLQNTEHSFLVGDQATDFAKAMGFKEESLTSDNSTTEWEQWKEKNCQPNFWTNVEPNPQEQCGPYQPISENSIYHDHKQNYVNKFNSKNHDTIGMIVIDKNAHIVAGTSTNGAIHKIPGRVGDSPIPGAGAYADNEVGAATATGDGDVMMRFLPSFLAVEELRKGSTPSQAARVAINRIVKRSPGFFGGIVVVNVNGEYGAACNGMDKFPFSVISNNTNGVTVIEVHCVKNKAS